MPVSSLQHRACVGNHHNKTLTNDKGKVTTNNRAQSFDPVTELEAIHRFGSHVQSVANSHQELSRLSTQPTAQHNMAVPFLMLLSQVRLAPPSLIENSPHSVLSGQQELIQSYGESASQSPISHYVSSGFTAVNNALQSIDDFIIHHDPLKFPAVEGTISNDWVDSLKISDVTMAIERGRFLSEGLANKASSLVQTMKNKEDLYAIDAVINKLNLVVYDAEDAYPSKETTTISADRLIYIIEKAEKIISEFEVKIYQDDFCKQLRLQLGNYIKHGVEIKDKDEALKFNKFMAKSPEIKFDADKRGISYPTVEAGIADSLIDGVFWFEDDNGFSASSGLRYQAQKCILASVLAAKGINDTSKLRDDWYKGDGVLRLYNILYRDIEYNLKNKGPAYLFGAARLFYAEYCSLNSAENIANIRGLDKKPLSSYTDEDKLTLLMHYFNQPVDVESSQKIKLGRFMKMVDFILLMQSIEDFIKPESAIEQREGVSSNRQGASSVSIYGRQSESRFQNFKLKFNREKNQLSVIPTHRMGIKRQAALMRRNTKILARSPVKSIKFKPKGWKGNDKIVPTITKSVRKKITPEMIEKNFDPKKIIGQNDIGLMLHENGKKYLKVNKSYVEIKANNGHLYIKSAKGNLHIEYRNGKITTESHRVRLARIKETGLSGRVLVPNKIISEKLNISEGDAKNILSEYEFPEGSDLYTEGTFALSVKETGNFPEWAASFKKISTEDYLSPYLNNNVMDNGLLGFQGKSGYFYRVDTTPPGVVLKNGFRASEDFTAIPKMLPEETEGVIFSETLEGARRYQTLSKDAYLYRIEGEGVEGVSLRDNLYKNEKGLNEFLGEPLAKQHTTLESLAEDTNGAIYLDEVHLNKGTIKPSKITVVGTDQLQQPLSSGPWQKYL